MDYNLLGYLLLAIAVLAGGHVYASRPGRPFPAKLVVLALALRVVGSLARYEILYRYYDGMGDAAGYYGAGVLFARRIWDLDLWVFDLESWLGEGRWWGTPFVKKLSGIVLTFIGPSMRAEFLAFGVISFIGLYLIALAFHRLVPPEMSRRYAAWLLVWPSLWFWPASAGKEALILLATGLMFYGYVGRRSRARWLPYLAGVLLAFAIRPHVAAMMVFATVVAHWLGSWERFTLRRLFESIAAVALAVLVLDAMAARFGLPQPDLESLNEFMALAAENTLTGGSNIGGVPSGITGIPMAFVNIWMRPFPWEAHNLTSLLSAAELVVFWTLIFRYRKGLRVTLAYWRRHRALRIALPLLVGYTLMIGLTFGNLGIIARQRAPIFPFFLMALAVAPVAMSDREARRSPTAPPLRERTARTPPRSPTGGADAEPAPRAT